MDNRKQSRWLQKVIAWFGGYFWLPCPICLKNFGGHEWADGHHGLYNGDGTYTCVCPNCEEKAKKLNILKYGKELPFAFPLTLSNE